MRLHPNITSRLPPVQLAVPLRGNLEGEDGSQDSRTAKDGVRSSSAVLVLLRIVIRRLSVVRLGSGARLRLRLGLLLRSGGSRALLRRLSLARSLRPSRALLSRPTLRLANGNSLSRTLRLTRTLGGLRGRGTRGSSAQPLADGTAARSGGGEVTRLAALHEAGDEVGIGGEGTLGLGGAGTRGVVDGAVYGRDGGGEAVDLGCVLVMFVLMLVLGGGGAGKKVSGLEWDGMDVRRSWGRHRQRGCPARRRGRRGARAWRRCTSSLLRSEVTFYLSR